jgi:hypothetical protein
MKKLILSAVLAISFASCNQSPNGQVYVQPAQQQDVVVTPTTSQIGDNLDLQALGEVVKQSNSAEEIENKLNQSGSINNLDLDGDGQVDYIKVNEVNDANGRGFVFLVDGPNGSEQVAQISLSQSGDLANLNIQGNPTYYGSNNYYTTSHLVRDMMIYNYLYGGYHRPYYSPYRYGHYPSHYRSYRISGYHSSPRVVSRTTTTRTTSRPVSKTYNNSSSYGKSSGSSAYRTTTQAGTRARSSSAPTSSQKSFKVTNSSNSRPKTSGFGTSRSSSSSSSYSSRPRSSSSSSYSSGRSSSRGSSSFGSSSRSSSRSSSSSRSRR